MKSQSAFNDALPSPDRPCIVRLGGSLDIISFVLFFFFFFVRPSLLTSHSWTLFKRCVFTSLQGYLVASTMAAKRLEEIGTFLKWNQILEMSHRRRLSSLIIWRQVFPESEDAGNRSFLVVVGSVGLSLSLDSQDGLEDYIS
jgi:hypothetical protein